MPMVEGADVRFARVSTGDGLSQTKVVQIIQDDQGFMWFGTQYGLNRYDGYNFKLFLHDPRDPGSLGCVFIRALFKDRSGALWVGCDQSLSRLDLSAEKFTRYPVPSVVQVSQDRAGMLWLSARSGLYGLDPVSGSITHFSHRPDDPASLSSSDVKSSGEDRAGAFWVSTSQGLDRFDRGTGKVTLHIPLHASSDEYSFYEDRSGMFWIFQVQDGVLAVLDRKTNRLTRYLLHASGPDVSAVTGLTAMTEDQNGTLWLATHGAGLL